MRVRNYNEEKVCTDSDTTSAVFCVPSTGSTEMKNIDTDSFTISVLRITDL